MTHRCWNEALIRTDSNFLGKIECEILITLLNELFLTEMNEAIFNALMKMNILRNVNKMFSNHEQ